MSRPEAIFHEDQGQKTDDKSELIHNPRGVLTVVEAVSPGHIKFSHRLGPLGRVGHTVECPYNTTGDDKTYTTHLLVPFCIRI